jgi:iron complex outermembrane receptor protein
MQLHRKAGSLDTTSAASERSSPESQVILRSSLDLGKHVQFDQLARYVSPIMVSGIRIPSYWTLDARLAWKPNRHWEFEVVGQNLVEQRHAEFAPTFIATQPIDIERSVFGRITFWY